MKPIYRMFMIFAVIVACNCDEKPNTQTAQERKSVVTVTIKDEGVNVKRQAGQEGNPALTQHIQYGASPGHYVLKTDREDSPQINAEYYNLLKKLQGVIQPSAAEPKPAIQQYVVQRNPRPYQFRPAAKVVKEDQYAENEQPLYLDDKYFVAQQYQQPRAPLILRPSQAVKASPMQGVYTNQGYIPMSNGHALHEARVQAALSVADNKQGVYASSQSVYKAAARPQSAFADSSFEKELAELVAANQAVELKERPQQFTYYQQVSQNTPQLIAGSPAPKKFSQTRLSPQTSSYSAAIPLARSKTPAPQQYLIETTRPQAVQGRAPQKAKPQYLQVYPEEPKYVEYQPVEQKSALKIVSAPSLQTAQPPQQYEYITQKQDASPPPSYLKYYQSIKPQTEEVSAPKEVKIGQYYPKYNIVKPQPNVSQAPTEEQQYVVQYQSQARPQEQSPEYSQYDSVKPETVQYARENEAFLRAILAQSQAQKSNRGNPAYTEKSVKIQPKPQPKPNPPKDEAHSSIFVSKTIVPKKQEQSVKILNPSQSEPSEEVQTVRLPPPKNNKVYTQDEFQALLAAGYSVTPIPVTDDYESPAKFSPAPPNYPGHSDYQVQYVSDTPMQQYYEKSDSDVYSSQAVSPQPQVLRKRKQRRPTSPPEYGLRRDTIQGVSETQTQLKYSRPLESDIETVNYGLRKQPKARDISNA